MKRIERKKEIDASAVLMEGMKEIISKYQHAVKSERIKVGIANKKARITANAYE